MYHSFPLLVLSIFILDPISFLGISEALFAFIHLPVISISWCSVLHFALLLQKLGDERQRVLPGALA